MSEQVQWGTWQPAIDPKPLWSVHVKRSAGEAVCDRAIPGELLTRQAAEVTCPDCTKWAHA